MKTTVTSRTKRLGAAGALALLTAGAAQAQTVAFPGAGGFGRFATGARGVASPSVYIVTNLNDAGPGSFRDAVSQPGRVVTFAVGGIVNLQSNVQVAPNVTVAGQTAPGDGVVFFNKRVTFTGASNTICRFLRVRLGSTNNQGNDASGLANGSNIILDHMSFSWGMDEVFSINWDGKGTAPDNITVQNSIIGQGLHRANHSAGGLIQTPDGGKVSLVGNLYISNKTRNPKVKGINEFVNNVVYDWGNGNRLGDIPNYGWSGDAYIMGGSAGVSEVNIINNYFVGGPLTPPDKTTPFSRGTGTFNLYGSGNLFDNNRNGLLDGQPVPYDTVGYPGIV
ncbi:pectate lyase family protein, partial [Hymenobacter persicinus]